MEKLKVSQLGAGVEIVERDFDLAYRENKQDFKNARARLLDCFGFGVLDSQGIRERIGTMGCAVESLAYGYLEGKAHYDAENELCLLLEYCDYKQGKRRG